MREVSQAVSNDDLLAYGDGRLSPDRTRVVEEYLRDHPDAAQFVEAVRQQNEELQAAFDPVLRETVPAHLVAASRRRPLTRSAIYAATALLIGLIGGWSVRDYRLSQDAAAIAAMSLTDRAALAHSIYVAREEPPLDMQSPEPTVVAEWLEREIGIRMRAPSLNDLGYDLLGGRLMVGSERPAGLLVYAAEDGRRVSLFILNDLHDDMAPSFTREGALGVVRWAQAGRGYGLAGPLDQHDLDTLASVIRLKMRVAAASESWQATA